MAGALDPGWTGIPEDPAIARRGDRAGEGLGEGLRGSSYRSLVCFPPVDAPLEGTQKIGLFSVTCSEFYSAHERP